MEEHGRCTEGASWSYHPNCSFAFILGVFPLVVSRGAGAEGRRLLGTAVFSGMLGVTFFDLLLTPVFYFVIRAWVERRAGRRAPEDTRALPGLAPDPGADGEKQRDPRL